MDILLKKKKGQKRWAVLKDTTVSRHSSVALTELLLTFLMQLLSTADQVRRGQGSLVDPSLLKTGPEITFSKRNFKVRVPYPGRCFCSSCWYP